MHELNKQVSELKEAIDKALVQLDIAKLESEYEALTTESLNSSFWDDNLHAQSVMKQIAKLEARTKPWRELAKSVAEVSELAKLNDPSLQKDLEAQAGHATKAFEALKQTLKLAGEYDDFDAIVALSAGAGGTDAQDWTAMLLRMYSRWADDSGLKLQLIEESAGDEAGLKSVTFDLSGSLAYGRIKGEHGVHRLVRLSPFNSDNLRQTSFAKVEVLPKIDQPEAIPIDEKDLKIDVYRSGGHGGQSVNTTDSAVRVTHLPTGITVAIQNERSQLQNKETAMTILRSRLAHLKAEQHAEDLRELKGPVQSAEWGNQIRSYVLHPYKQVKDLRSGYESSDVESVLDGKLDQLIDAYLEHTLGEEG